MSIEQFPNNAVTTLQMPGGLNSFATTIYVVSTGLFPIQAQFRIRVDKGFSSILRWCGTPRSNGDTISNTGANSRDTVWLNGALLPWDGSIPSL